MKLMLPVQLQVLRWTGRQFKVLGLSWCNPQLTSEGEYLEFNFLIV